MDMLNEIDKAGAREELKRAKKYCWIGEIFRTVGLVLLLKSANSVNYWLGGLALFLFIMGTYIHQRELGIIGYIKGYDDGYIVARNKEYDFFGFDFHRVGCWNKVEI